MNDDLMKRLLDYRPVLDEAIDANRGVQRLDSVHPRSHRRALALVGSIAVAAAGVAAFVVVRHSGSPHASAPSSTSMATPDSWAWLEGLGAEAPAPKIPEGWQVMDYGDLRFAVPGDWTVPTSTQCAQSSHGLVLLQPTNALCPAVPAPQAVLTISTHSVGSAQGNRVSVGTLGATLIPANCEGCRPTYWFDNGYSITVTGADSGSILATFTDSGARRVLQTGAELDTAGWQQVKREGVEYLVPPGWQVTHMLEESLFGGGDGSPLPCGNATFNPGNPAAFTGYNGIYAACLGNQSFDLNPHDGLWIRKTDETVASVAHGTVGDLSVSVLRRSLPPYSWQGAVLDLRIRTSGGDVAVTIGTGVDTAIARTIMHSLRSAPDTVDDTAPPR